MDILIGIMIWSIIIFRVADDFVLRDGPFEIFVNIRSWAYRNDKVPAWVSNGMQCRICVSWWLTLAVAIYHFDIRYYACAGVVTLLTILIDREA